MTVIDVSVPTYYDTAQKLADAASQFWSAVDGEWPAMAQATNMAGSYSDGKKWGESYDTRATEILDLVSRLATAAHGYAVILQQIGYNHECAEWVATVDNNAIPVKPAEPIPPVIVCRIPLPLAGGPGNGLVDEGIGLAEMIGIIVPDGNATTMSNAADTWERTARTAAVAGFPAALDAAATALQTITAPESAYVDEDLRALKTAADTVITAMADLAQSCRDHRQALDELRNNLKIQLESIRDALLTELAINAAVDRVELDHSRRQRGYRRGGRRRHLRALRPSDQSHDRAMAKRATDCPGRQIRARHSAGRTGSQAARGTAARWPAQTKSGPCAADAERRRRRDTEARPERCAGQFPHRRSARREGDP
ncbi:hypothetical protein ABZ894_01810 [Nocardia beijingensis]|uniref:WXG100-like domain-containing protein n=1 Tax=Nocardia beijingensis TaxID=95162 RepID=UPI003408F7D2